MNFDGAACKEGEGTRFWVKPLEGRALNYSYKFTFDCTNNEEGDEAMMLEIQILKYFQPKRVVVHGESELVIKKMQGEY